jgi:hypothetical protein
VLITAASVQDRDAAKPLLWNLTKAFPAIRLAWADGIYAGKLVAWAITALKLTLQIVRRPDDLALKNSGVGCMARISGGYLCALVCNEVSSGSEPRG